MLSGLFGFLLLAACIRAAGERPGCGQLMPATCSAWGGVSGACQVQKLEAFSLHVLGHICTFILYSTYIALWLFSLSGSLLDLEFLKRKYYALVSFESPGLSTLPGT